MRRRTLLQATPLLALPAIGRAQSVSTLKFVPYADLALLDPLVSSFVTRNHVMMVFDTLFALDSAGVPQPQMLAGTNVATDGLTWDLTLRDGLRFHDGTPVLARDVVASLHRWTVSDAFGQALLDATNELAAPSDKLIRFRLKRPFPLLPNALAKPTNLMAAIMPERLATQPTDRRMTEMVGSGPFQYVAEERVPGARNVYRKFAGYVPRSDGTPSFCAGPRVAHFDRIEWITMPDSGTQIDALKAGEVDWVEQPLMDLVPGLQKNQSLKVEVIEDTGLIGVLRFNQLYPPFDNAKLRQIVLKAVNQRDYMQAVAGDNPALYNDHVGLFPPGFPLANDAGMEVLSGKHDIATLRKEVAESGYKGEKIVFLVATDVPRTSAICQVGVQMMRQIGLNVDDVSTDWGTVVQRINSRQPIEKGGWTVFGSFWGGYDFINPAGYLPLRGNGKDAWNGWPTSAALENDRTKWLLATDDAARLQIAREIQLQAWQDVPFLPVGSYYQPTAYRSDLTGMLKGLPLFTNIRRT